VEPWAYQHKTGVLKNRPHLSVRKEEETKENWDFGEVENTRVTTVPHFTYLRDAQPEKLVSK
jgi:hypothetical protein